MYRWSAIATHLPRRTDNEIKNYWNTHLKKRLALMGIDPVTHKPSRAAASDLCHMAQWERTRLEAEARLVANRRRANEQSASVEAQPLSSEQILKKMPTTFAPPRCPDILRLFSTGSDPFIGLQYRKSEGSQPVRGAAVDEVMDWDINTYLNDVLDLVDCGSSNLPEF